MIAHHSNLVSLFSELVEKVRRGESCGVLCISTDGSFRVAQHFVNFCRMCDEDFTIFGGNRLVFKNQTTISFSASEERVRGYLNVYRYERGK